VIAASAGNHAQGVALAAQLLGIKSTVYMPVGASITKVMATKGYGADVKFIGALLAIVEKSRQFRRDNNALTTSNLDWQAK
jgi:threonine dehydratase